MFCIKQVYYFIRYCFVSVFYYKFRLTHKLHILSREDTVKKIINDRCSVSRYGDGEFGIIQNNNTTFQDSNDKLSERLSQCLTSKCPDVLVCLPVSLMTDDKMNFTARRFWREYVFKNYNFLVKIPMLNCYGDTQFTRFYMDRNDKQQTAKYVEFLKKIWNKRPLLIVEGNGSRLGVGNDLFNNAISIRRILCPSVNAFEQYDRIYTSVITYCKENKDTLVLCALGMTATVLAYDIALWGGQAIDIGHVDIEYCWYKMNARTKVAVPSKSVNECGLNNVPPLEDEEYKHQIILEIK